MGGYNPDNAYNSRASFLICYFFGFHQKRLEFYNHFLRGHLSKGDAIPFIASRRRANELFLIQDGYEITCSNMGIPYIRMFGFKKGLGED